MYMYTFLLRMADTVTSQNKELYFCEENDSLGCRSGGLEGSKGWKRKQRNVERTVVPNIALWSVLQ
jgi:hypothetical protein